jgi:hypothetical protein
MTRSTESIISNSLHRVPNIQNNLRLIRGLDTMENTRILLILDLQSTNRVLEEHRDTAEICVLGDACGGTIG